MSGLRRLFSCIGMAVLAQGPKALMGAIPFGDALYDIAADALKRLRAKPDAEVNSELAETAQTEAATAHQEAEAVAAEVAADQPAEVRVNLVSYLSLVPDSIRQSLKRPADPTGMTVPSGLAMQRPEQLLPFLPSRLPRFKPGDRPTPGGNWELVEMLGVGGFGEVWKARHPHLKSIQAALKFCLDSRASATLRHEGAILDRVMQHGNHPGIVPLRQAHLDADPCFLEYEYIDGGNLSAIISKRPAGNALFLWAAQLVRNLAGTVGAFHRLNPPIVHRDLKPANILLQRVVTGDKKSVRLRIADFGIGGLAANRALEQAQAGSTSRGDLMFTSMRGSHTPLYASPQQSRGESPDVRDDVHALGVIWFQLLTGDMSSGAGPGYDEDLRELGANELTIALLGQCVSPKPDRRPKDAADMAERLDAVLASGAKPQMASGDLPTLKPIVRPALSQAPVSGIVPTLKDAAAAGAPDVIQRTVEPRPSKPQIITCPKCPMRMQVPCDAAGKQVRCPSCQHTFIIVAQHDSQPSGADIAAERKPSQPQVIQLTVAIEGQWQSRSVSNTEAEWVDETKTPATVSVEPGKIYRLRMSLGGGHRPLASLTELRNVTAFQSFVGHDFGKSMEKELPHLGRLTALRDLTLIVCDALTDQTFAYLSGLVCLESLDLSSNTEFTGEGLSHLAQLPAVQTLNLSNCYPFSGTGLRHLRAWPRLKTLDLSQNPRLEEDNLQHLTTIQTVEMLDLRRCARLTGRGLAALSGMKRLRTLDLSECEHLTDSGLAHLSGLDNLENLKLSKCSLLTDAGLSHLRGLIRLRSLSLTKCKQITDEGLASFRGMMKLTKLDLSHCLKVTGEGLSSLSNKTSLEELSLGQCIWLVDGGLAHLRKLNALKSLDLSSCDELTDAGLLFLSKLILLEQLNLSECKHLTDCGIAHLRNLTALKKLSLQGCEGLTDSGMTTLPNMPRLQELNLAGCKQLTDSGIAHISRLAALKELSLDGCENIVGVGFREFHRCTALVRLDLRRCIGLTDEALTHLSKLPALRDIDLSHSRLLTRERCRYLINLHGWDSCYLPEHARDPYDN